MGWRPPIGSGSRISGFPPPPKGFHSETDWLGPVDPDLGFRISPKSVYGGGSSRWDPWIRISDFSPRCVFGNGVWLGPPKRFVRRRLSRWDPWIRISVSGSGKWGRKSLVGTEDFVDRVETRKARRKIFFCPAKGCWTGIWNIFRTSPKVRVGSCVDWGPALSSPSDDISIKPLYSQRGLYDEDGAKVSDGGGAKVSDLWSDKRGVA